MKLLPRIRISGESFLLNEIAKIASVKLQQNLKDWERDFWLFASEWFDENDFVAVKTSGSTGEPKSIQLPKMVMQKSAERTINYFKLKKGDHLLQSLSGQYIAGKMMFVRAIVGQMNLSVVDPSTDFSFLDTEKFDFGALVPLQVSNILSTEMGTNRVENIKYLLVGGSAVPVQLESKIRQLKNNVVSTYGMTETASHIAVRTLSGSNYSENYHCLHDISIRKNEEDCLEILPEEQNKWLSTTDLVEIISPTEFKIIGRADYAIISGGLKFHPEKLEYKLEKYLQMPFMITSEPDEKLGQKLILKIEGNYSVDVKDELQQKIESLLTGYECPRKIVFVNRLPRNENGKIIRR